MKKFTLLSVLTILFVGIVSSQNYEITFSADGGQAELKSVKIQNLNKGTEVILSGNQTLLLTGTTKTIENDFQKIQVKSYPNPFVDKTNIEFNSPVSGTAKISIVDISGRIVVDKTQIIDPGYNVFEVSGIRSGLYLCLVVVDNYEYSTQIISQNTFDTKPEIIFKNRVEDVRNTFSMPKISSVSMLYTDGDLLMATAFTQQEASVLTFVPDHCCNINFEMYACVDGSGNNYKTVRIGNQIWMAENLRTTKFNDSTEIYLGIDHWGSLQQAAYCWYNHNQTEFAQNYGALYNYYAINSEKNICPIGWHVPSDEEFAELQTTLNSDAGAKLKDGGHGYWQLSNCSGTNESGFTALPAGYRGGLGGFSDEKLNAYFWTSTPSIAGKAWVRNLSYENNTLNSINAPYYSGMSVRCVKN